MNYTTIGQLQRAIELEHHDVILVEGLAVETYLDDGQRYVSLNDPITGPYPDSHAGLREMAGRASRALTRESLRAVRFAFDETTRLRAFASGTHRFNTVQMSGAGSSHLTQGEELSMDCRNVPRGFIP